MPQLIPEKQAVLERMEDLLRRATDVTFIVPDDTGFFSIEDDLVAKVRDLMADALDLMREITVLYDDEGPASPDLDDTAVGEDEDLLEIGAAISSELAAQEVSNMAFAVRAQLAENFDALVTALDGGSIWVVVSHADTGLRRVGRGLISLDSAIREYENLEPVERMWSSLEDSLEIRRLYGQFRRAILRGRDVGDADDLGKKLKSAALRIAILRDRKIYPFLRIYDRVPIRRLQKRILGWLDRDPSDLDREQDGRRLWSDLVSFAELLVQINSREELREHDRRTVERLYGTLFDGPSPAQDILPGHLADLERLLGRDDDLDRVVLAPREHRTEDLRAPLGRLRGELNQPFAPVEETLAPLLDPGS
ncbi:MAG: hypothetical protein AAGE94_08085 [Acidobacteriota bacterium]